MKGESSATSKSPLLDAAGMRRTLSRMVAEILERDPDEDLILVGIHTRGVPLAERLAKRLREQSGREIAVGTLDITLYRDDVGPWRPAHKQPVLRKTALPSSIDDRIIYLVDDVLFTGRTIRAALNTLVDYGRARGVRLAVLIDRGHRELPIAADVVGRVIATDRDEDVQVRLREVDGCDEVRVGREADHGN